MNQPFSTHNIVNKRKEYLEKFKKAKMKFVEELIKMRNTERQLYYSLKDYQASLKDELIEEINNKLTDIENKELVNNSIMHIMLFKKETSEGLKEFRNLIEKEIKLEETLFDNKEFIFKKCPYCGEIWTKDSDCDNITCGDILSLKKYLENKERDKLNKDLIKPIGCGKSLKWSECPDVTNEIKKILIN